MANPPRAPVAASCADPTSTGATWGPAVLTISEALAASVRSIEVAGSGAEAPVSWGNVKGSVSGPFPLGSIASPKRLRRAVVEDEPSATSVKVVVQFSALAVCGMEPARVIPGTEDACCSTEKLTPATDNTAETSEPLFWPTWNLTMPFPAPEIAFVNVTQLGMFVMVQEQFEVVVIVMVPTPPVEEKTAPPGLTS